MAAQDDTPGGWIELRISASIEAVDAIAEVFRANGVPGIAVEPAGEPDVDEGWRPALEGNVTVLAYIASDGSQSRLSKIERDVWHLSAFGLSPISCLETRQIMESDWASAWKEHFFPIRIGRRVVVKPSWRDFEASPHDIVIELDPGMAFGTGLHPTTAMMIEAIEENLPLHARVLDVGTGSGILAIAAAKLGAAEVLAVDVEPVAVRVARENVALNGSEQVTIGQGSAEAGQGNYDLVLANIVATVIAELIPMLCSQLAKSGTLVVSGIIEERAELVLEAARKADLEVRRTLQSGDWLCYSLVRTLGGAAHLSPRPSI